MSNQSACLSSARLYLHASFSLHRPRNEDNYQPSSVKGSSCLASPYAFQYKKIVGFVNAHKYSDWLLFAYAGRTDFDLFKRLACQVWQQARPALEKDNSPEKLLKISLLAVPAVIEHKGLVSNGKLTFKTIDLCQAMGIDFKNNHFHRDYKTQWELILKTVKEMDAAALVDVDNYIFEKGLYKWPLLENT